MNTLAKGTERHVLKEAQTTSKLGVVKTGIALAAVLAGWHAGWATLVAVGMAQPVIDFIMKVHFIDARFTIQPFDLSTAGLLVGMNAAIGFAFGSLFAFVWNSMHRGN